MADLVLRGNLNLMGTLTLGASGGGKVMVGALEALLEHAAPGEPAHGIAPPVIIPPPPATPLDLGPNVWIINSFNKTVKISTGLGAKPIVTQGMVSQGGQSPSRMPTWPGMVLPSQGNSTVTIVPPPDQRCQRPGGDIPVRWNG